jgi:hypothetical protein
VYSQFIGVTRTFLRLIFPAEQPFSWIEMTGRKAVLMRKQCHIQPWYLHFSPAMTMTCDSDCINFPFSEVVRLKYSIVPVSPYYPWISSHLNEITGIYLGFEILNRKSVRVSKTLKKVVHYPVHRQAIAIRKGRK